MVQYGSIWFNMVQYGLRMLVLTVKRLSKHLDALPRWPDQLDFPCSARIVEKCNGWSNGWSNGHSTDAMTAESPPCAGVSTAARHFQPMIRSMQETAMRAAVTQMDSDGLPLDPPWSTMIHHEIYATIETLESLDILGLAPHHIDPWAMHHIAADLATDEHTCTHTPTTYCTHSAKL